MIELIDVKNGLPNNFILQSIIYSNEVYSIAYGNWENSDYKLALNLKSNNSSSSQTLWTLLPFEGLKVKNLIRFLDKIENLESKLNLFEILVSEKL
jgi:hypothetical protein